jgi:hypothetical protein
VSGLVCERLLAGAGRAGSPHTAAVGRGGVGQGVGLPTRTVRRGASGGGGGGGVTHWVQAAGASRCRWLLRERLPHPAAPTRHTRTHANQLAWPALLPGAACRACMIVLCACPIRAAPTGSTVSVSLLAPQCRRRRRRGTDDAPCHMHVCRTALQTPRPALTHPCIWVCHARASARFAQSCTTPSPQWWAPAS